MNATPAKNAQACFPLDDSEEVPDDQKKKDTDESATPNNREKDKTSDDDSFKKDDHLDTLKEGLIHVRGTGNNQFGTFELLGSFDVSTGTLECQRMYVTSIEPPTKENTPQRRRSSSRQGVEEAASLIRASSKNSNDGRPYFTRKKQISFKRRASFGGDSDEEATTGATRRRSASTGNAAGGSATKRVRVAEPKPAHSTAADSAVPQTAVPAVAGAPLSITIPSASSTGKRPGPAPKTGTPRAKKATSGSSKSGTPKEAKQQSGSLSTPSSSNYMKLPAVGDPKMAIWRAAHYLYYQKNDPSQEEGGSTGSSGTSGTNASGNAFKYVVYEGEMIKSHREGRGVCVYSNQTLYEGKATKRSVDLVVLR